MVSLPDAAAGGAPRERAFYCQEFAAKVTSAAMNAALLFRRMLVGFGRCERKFGSAVEHVALLGSESLLVIVGLDGALTGLGRHGAQGLQRIPQRLATLLRQLLVALVEPTRLIFLLRRQVLPGFHAIQHAVLLLRTHAVKTL